MRFQIQRRVSHRELQGVSKNMRPPVVCLRIFPFGGTVPFTICLFLQFVLFYNSYVFRSLSVCSKICSCLPDCFVRRCTFVVFAVPSCVRRGLHRIFLAKCEKILLENSHLCYNKYVMGRVMALDVGDVRIGVAVSDLMGIISF